MKILSKSFYLKDPAVAAKELLGKLLVRKLGNEELLGKIVETEAYYGLSDPASRVTKKAAESFSLKAGQTFIYMVHNSWLLNIVANKKDKPQGVLIRAVEPLNNLEILKKNRKGKDCFLLTNGPGKLTQAMKITKEHHGIMVYAKDSDLTIAEGTKEHFIIISNHRIGIRNDLKRKLRFYIEGSKWVSKI